MNHLTAYHGTTPIVTAPDYIHLVDVAARSARVGNYHPIEATRLESVSESGIILLGEATVDKFNTAVSHVWMRLVEVL